MNYKLWRRDLYFSISIICISLYLMMKSFSYPANSSFFPRILSILLLALSLIVLLKLFRQRIGGGLLKKHEEQTSIEKFRIEKYKSGKRSIWKNPVIIVFFSLVLYVGITPLIGFFMASILFMFVFLLLNGLRNWLVLLIISIVPVAILYFSFSIFFHILFPTGYLVEYWLG